jgi:formylglycine-generating enzyme required for sulfatase activity
MRSLGKKANPWDLNDVHGNVKKWCRDWYGKQLAGGTDPRGPSLGWLRVYRGGGWDDPARVCRSAYRQRFLPKVRWGNYYRYEPPVRLNNLGFRVASVPPGK